MTEAVVVAACRTAIGTSFKGSLVNTTAYELAETVIAGVVDRSGIDPALIEDVVFGESMYGGGDVARYAALTSGLRNVPGVALNRHCASGLAAVASAAGSIKSGMEDAVIAGGVMSMSTGPIMRWRTPGTTDFEEMWISPSHPDDPEAPNRDMSLTVGWSAATQAGISREEQDAWALASHQKAIAATDDGRLAEEIVPIKITTADGGYGVFSVDEHPRRATSAEKLASLSTLHPEIDGFSVTAGNSSGVNDGAAALLLTSDTFAAEQGLTPLATVRSWASVGVEPRETGLAPTIAIPKALAKAGLTLDDVDLFEINEAFASVPIAAAKVLGIDPGKINPVGSGCSLGHPVAASGARMLTSLVYELRRRGGGIGVASMCAGGGMGGAVVIEVAG